jgi:hypothetical protein
MNSPEETRLVRELRELASGQPFRPDPEAIGRRARHQHRRGIALRGITVAAATVLAAGGLFVAVHGTGGTAPGATASRPPATGSPAVGSKLVSLATHIQATTAPLPGNASLIRVTHIIGGKTMQVFYELDTDSGAIYTADTESGLPAAIAQHGNIAVGDLDREVAVARTAATGDLASARIQMIDITPNYLGLGLSPAAQKKEWVKGLAAERAAVKWIYQEKHVKFHPRPYNSTEVQELADNYLWIHATSALTTAGDNPQVRAGVLRLISTISGVTVANSTTDGQPTLTLTAGPEVFTGQGKEVLTISAKTGMPITDWSGDLGPHVSSGETTYQTSRVTVANIEAGRF